MAVVNVAWSTRGTWAVDIKVDEHALIADEPAAAGGNDLGPAPHDFLLAGLGACTAMTLRMYAKRKGFALEDVKVRLTRRKIEAKDCADCTTTQGEVEEITREIVLVGPLDSEARARLMDIADRCPVHRTLTGEIKIRSALVEAFT